MDSSISLKDQIWFLHVCHHVSNMLYRTAQPFQGKPSSDRAMLPAATYAVAHSMLVTSTCYIQYLHHAGFTIPVPYQYSTIWQNSNTHAVHDCCFQQTCLSAASQFALFYIWLQSNLQLGTVVAQRLRCCATNRKVTGSIPVSVTGTFHWHKILPIAL